MNIKRIRTAISDMKKNMEEASLLKRIEEGLKNNEFKMHLQFIVENKTNKIVSAEALSRWETHEGEIIMPGRYIGLLENSGLITKFDYYMLEKVCESLSKMQ